MSSMNKVILVGRCGGNVDVHTFDNGGKKLSFSLATNENWKNKAGEWVEDTEWHNVSVNGALAERLENTLTKGRMVLVEGRIQSRTYEKDGQTRKFYGISAKSVRFLDKRMDASASSEPAVEDDLPF